MENIVNLRMYNTNNNIDNYLQIINKGSIKTINSNSKYRFNNIYNIKKDNDDEKINTKTIIEDSFKEKNNLIIFNTGLFENSKEDFNILFLNNLKNIIKNDKLYKYDIYLNYYQLEKNNIYDLLKDRKSKKVSNFELLKEVLVEDLNNFEKYIKNADKLKIKNESVIIWKINIKKYNENFVQNIFFQLIDYLKKDSYFLLNLIKELRLSNVKDTYFKIIFNEIIKNKNKIVINLNISNNKANKNIINTFLNFSQNIIQVFSKRLKYIYNKDEILTLENIYDYKFKNINNKYDKIFIQFQKLKEKNKLLKHNMKLKDYYNSKAGILFKENLKNLEKINVYIINSGLVALNLNELKIKKIEELINYYLKLIEDIVNKENLETQINSLSYKDLLKYKKIIEEKISKHKKSFNNITLPNTKVSSINDIILKNIKLEKSKINKLFNDKYIKFYEKYFKFNIKSYIDWGNLNSIKSDYGKFINKFQSTLNHSYQSNKELKTNNLDLKNNLIVSNIINTNKIETTGRNINKIDLNKLTNTENIYSKKYNGNTNKNSYISKEKNKKTKPNSKLFRSDIKVKKVYNTNKFFRNMNNNATNSLLNKKKMFNFKNQEKSKIKKNKGDIINMIDNYLNNDTNDTESLNYSFFNNKKLSCSNSKKNFNLSQNADYFKKTKKIDWNIKKI